MDVYQIEHSFETLIATASARAFADIGNTADR